MNTNNTQLVAKLRYFRPEVNPKPPGMGAYRKNKFT
jgi:hypothetical protein